MKKTELKNRHVVASCALILCAPLAVTATNYSFNADSGALRISYSDLYLDSNEGVSALYKRLQSASRLACGSTSYPQVDLKTIAESKACYAKTLSLVVTRVANAKLTALHENDA